jgi:phosphatidylinositol glycan class O
MDDDTILIAFGDHGMTDEGNHGGGSENEIRSVIFSYSKKGFPMKKYQSLKLDSSVKQLDLAAIVSMIFGLSIPFSNLGVIN